MASHIASCVNYTLARIHSLDMYYLFTFNITNIMQRYQLKYVDLEPRKKRVLTIYF